MNKFSKTKFLIAIVLSLMILAGGVYTFFFNAMKQKTEEATDLLSKIEELSGKESKFSSSVAALKEESAHIERLRGSFVKESGIILFTKKIEALGAQSGTTLSIESLDSGLGAVNTPILSFRIKATGTFSGVMNALALIENLPLKLEWQSAQLFTESGSSGKSGPAEKKGLPIWTLNVSVVALNFVHE